MSEDGGPAFPRDTSVNQSGMSLRDYFAAAALTGMCANPNAVKENGEFSSSNFRTCYEMADAMIKAREGK